MDKKKYILLWGEHIELKSFLIGLLIQIVLLTIAMILPLKTQATKLVIGLIAIVLGLVINAIWIKPKRNINVTEVENNGN